MTSFGEGFATGFASSSNAAATAINAYQRGKLIELEQQKTNLEGYKTFRDMLDTWDPDTAKAAWPNVAKTLFNVDPGDAGTKNFYMSAFDKQSQIGNALRTTFSSMTPDPNDPVASIMKNVPIQTFAQMAKDPAKLTTFLKSTQDMSIQRQGIAMAKSAIDLVMGNSSAASAPAAAPAAAPATGTLQASMPSGPPTPTAAPAADTLQGNVQASTGVPAAPMNTAPMVPQAAAPAAQAAPVAQAPAVGTAAPAVGNNVTPGTTGPQAMAEKVSQMRKLGFVLTMNKMTEKGGEILSNQANALETNFFKSQENAIAAGNLQVNQQRAKLEAQRLKLDTNDKTWTQVPTSDVPNAQPGTMYFKNGNGEWNVKSLNPAMDDYYKGLANDSVKEYTAIRDNGQAAARDLKNIDELKAIKDNPATQPAEGMASTQRYYLGKLADFLHMPDPIVKSIAKSPAGAEVSQSVIDQMGLRFAQKLKSGSMGGFGEAFINEVQQSFPDLVKTGDGRNLIIDIMGSNSKMDQDLNDIWTNHMSQAPAYLPDKSGLTADQQVMNYLKANRGLSTDLQKRLSILSGTTPTTLGGQTGPAAAPTQTPLSGVSADQFIKAMQSVGP